VHFRSQKGEKVSSTEHSNKTQYQSLSPEGPLGSIAQIALAPILEHFQVSLLVALDHATGDVVMKAFQMQESREEDCEDVSNHSSAYVENNFERHIELFDGVANQDYNSYINSFANADVVFGVVLDIEQLEYTNSNMENFT